MSLMSVYILLCMYSQSKSGKNRQAPLIYDRQALSNLYRPIPHTGISHGEGWLLGSISRQPLQTGFLWSMITQT